MKVKDVMHFGAEWVDPETPITEIARMMRDDDIGCVPVGENDRLVGMVTDRDIVCRGLAAGGDCADLTAGDVMSKPIIYARCEEDIEDAMRLMERNKIRRLPVIDEEQRLTGMLSIGDISEKAGGELAGEILRWVAAHHPSSPAI
jgi:CBS domain-containing protein